MITAPFDERRDVVRPEWIDYNGHLNVGYYVLAFDFATDEFLYWLGLDAEHRERQGISTFALETHVTYQREVREGDPLRFTTQLLDYDAKRIHYFHRMLHGSEGFVAATSECMSLHVSRETRRAAPMHADVLARIEAVAVAHRALPTPPEVGRVMGLRAKPTTPSRAS